MKSLSNAQLNRIKIKDMMARILEDINPERGMSLYLSEVYTSRAEYALEKATDDDLGRIEKLFIKVKLGIEYFPSQNKKRIKINGSTKIVPIDYEYGSENN